MIDRRGRNLFNTCVYIQHQVLKGPHLSREQLLLPMLHYGDQQFRVERIGEKELHTSFTIRQSLFPRDVGIPGICYDRDTLVLRQRLPSDGREIQGPNSRVIVIYTTEYTLRHMYKKRQ